MNAWGIFASPQQDPHLILEQAGQVLPRFQVLVGLGHEKAELHRHYKDPGLPPIHHMFFKNPFWRPTIW